jgi:hypothetical protein
MKTYGTQPLVESLKTPRQIVGGPHQFKIFSDLIAVYERAAKSGIIPGKAELKNFDKQSLAAFPAILAELRENGYYTAGVDEKGNCRFEQARKSQSQVIYEAGIGEYARFSVEEFQQMARSGYLAIVRNVTVEKTQRHEVNAEAYR